MFYQFLNIFYTVVFNIFLVYRNHKLRLMSYAEQHFNTQTLTSFQEYLKAVPEAIIIYED